MIPLRFYRDKSHVYVNNPDGITKQMSIADFEAMLNGSGGGSGSGGVLVVKTLHDGGSTSHLDKTYAEICSAISEGKLVITYEFYKDEETGVFYSAFTGLINNAYFDEDTDANVVEIFTSFASVVKIHRYTEVEGVLVWDNTKQIPPVLTEGVVFMGNTLYATGPTLYDSLTKHYCYFVNGSAGTNKNYYYSAKEFGKDGSTYYVVLSNGDRYEGSETGRMTKVTVNP